MYDELIEKLRSSCRDCKLWDGNECCLDGDCTGRARLQAADAIEELSKERIGVWITPFVQKPVTNADRIRAMTDEELAEWICEVQDGESLQRENYLPSLSKGFWLKWLKRGASDA